MIGITIGETGHFVPFMIVGGAISTAATGLLMTLDKDSSPSAWIGYQALAGIGLGLCFNVPIIVTQRIAKLEEVGPATAIILCKYPSVLNEPLMRRSTERTDRFPTVFQSIGGALIVSAGQSIFQNSLISALPYTNPGLNPASVIQVGATQVQYTFSPDELSGIDDAYMKGLHRAFAMAIPMAGVATVIAATQKWFRLKSETS